MIFINRLRIPKWNKITVEMYQYINEINESQMDQVDKVLFTMAFLTGKSEEEFDKINKYKFAQLQRQFKQRFAQLKMQGKETERIKSFKFNFDIRKVTLGQFIEVQHFYKNNYMVNLHLIAASFSTCKDYSHVERADRILKMPLLPVLYNVTKFLEVIKKLSSEYNGLFGIEDMEEEDLKPLTNGFNEQYGWIYSAQKIAEFERIKLDEAYDLPIIQAFNDLAFLKAHQEYEAEINKRNINAVVH
jgi:NTP pyrophosphatase (non-canonical NTP hydrolase)